MESAAAVSNGVEGLVSSRSSVGVAWVTLKCRLQMQSAGVLQESPLVPFYGSWVPLAHLLRLQMQSDWAPNYLIASPLLYITLQGDGQTRFLPRPDAGLPGKRPNRRECPTLLGL